MAEKKIPKINILSNQLSDSDTPDKEADPRLRTSEEERQYGMIRYILYYILIYSSYIYMYGTVAVYLLIQLFTSTYI